MRDLGNLGESAFQMICADAGVIFNDSQIDKTGWDFIVEDKDYEAVDTLGEIGKSNFFAKVQVKATDRTHANNRLSLTNLLALATAAMPAFIVFLEFEKMNSVQRAYVVHVDEEFMKFVF